MHLFVHVRSNFCVVCSKTLSWMFLRQIRCWMSSKRLHEKVVSCMCHLLRRRHERGARSFPGGMFCNIYLVQLLYDLMKYNEVRVASYLIEQTIASTGV